MSTDNYKRIEQLGNIKYRFKQEYKGVLIYEQFSTNGYAVHNSFAIKSARAPWIKIDSYNHITEEMLLDMLDEAVEKGSLTFKGSKDKDGNYFFHDAYDEITLFVLDEKVSKDGPVNKLKKLEDRLQSVMDDCMEFSQNNEEFLESMDEFKDFNITVIAGLDEAIDSVRFCIENGKNDTNDVVKEEKNRVSGMTENEFNQFRNETVNLESNQKYRQQLKDMILEDNLGYVKEDLDALSNKRLESIYDNAIPKKEGSKGQDVAREAKDVAKGASGKSVGRSVEER